MITHLKVSRPSLNPSPYIIGKCMVKGGAYLIDIFHNPISAALNRCASDTDVFHNWNIFLKSYYLKNYICLYTYMHIRFAEKYWSTWLLDYELISLSHTHMWPLVKFWWITHNQAQQYVSAKHKYSQSQIKIINDLPRLGQDLLPRESKLFQVVLPTELLIK